VTPSLAALLSGAIDYAGLFPPATLDMQTAVDNYAHYRDGERAWMLGRFIVPVARLDEFLEASQEYVSVAGDPWRLGAIVGEDAESDFGRVAAFNQTNDGVLIDTIEVKADTIARVDTIAEHLPGGVRAFVEVGSSPDLTAILAAIAARRLGAKIRTGGVTSDAIPSVDEVARFIRACYARNIAFKATAGLHHPLRGEYALTYEEDAARATMHGFLNVFLTAAFCYNGIGAADAPRLLALEAADSWSFGDSATWEDYRVSVAEVEKVRRRLLISFGSCSFVEPIDDLQRLGLLGQR
jgi:hypothetical protein